MFNQPAQCFLKGSSYLDVLIPLIVLIGSIAFSLYLTSKTAA